MVHPDFFFVYCTAKSLRHCWYTIIILLFAGRKTYIEIRCQFYLPVSGSYSLSSYRRTQDSSSSAFYCAPAIRRLACIEGFGGEVQLYSPSSVPFVYTNATVLWGTAVLVRKCAVLMHTSSTRLYGIRYFYSYCTCIDRVILLPVVQNTTSKIHDVSSLDGWLKPKPFVHQNCTVSVRSITLSRPTPQARPCTKQIRIRIDPRIVRTENTTTTAITNRQRHDAFNVNYL